MVALEDVVSGELSALAYFWDAHRTYESSELRSAPLAAKACKVALGNAAMAALSGARRVTLFRFCGS